MGNVYEADAISHLYSAPITVIYDIADTASSAGFKFE
jgi:hypothetical protein